jgi:hypothetical protein
MKKIVACCSTSPSWQSSQARRALNPCMLQNASYKTRMINHNILSTGCFKIGEFRIQSVVGKDPVELVNTRKSLLLKKI